MNTIKKMIDLSGRCALITGACGGLGKMMAYTLAELGADLILIDRKDSDLNDLKTKLTDQWNVKVDCKTCDLEKQLQRDELISYLKKNIQTLNILINNAAFVGTSDLKGWAVSFEHQTLETWHRALEVNLTASFHLCHGLLPLLKSAEGANIINIASIYGLYGPDWNLYEDTDMGNPVAYSVSKGGLIQLTRWLALTIAPDVRVNCISPGGIFRNQPEEFVKKYNSKTPLGRMAIEDDLKGAVLFLATDLSKYITGQNIIVDGGWGV